MNSIEFSGNLKSEKDKLYQLACNYTGENIFVGQLQESYYKKYDDSKHLSGALAVYDSSEMSDFRERLETLWGTSACRVCIPVMMAAYRKSKDIKENMIRTVDLYNYAM